MKQYKLFSDYVGKKLEDQINQAAEDGYEIKFTLQQSHNGSCICVIMEKTTNKKELN